MPKDPAELVLPILDGLVADGEVLRSWCLATEQRTFSCHTTIVGVTDRRLLLRATDRRFRPKGDVLSIRPDELAEATADGAGHGWWSASAAILDSAALSVTLSTTTGARRTLTLIRGDGMFGKLSGGDAQRNGVEALAAWLRVAD